MKHFLLSAIVVFALVGLAMMSPARAQDHSGHSEHVGKESREIKSLSGERVEQLLAGAGAGYALPAELNQYPGPRHVIDHASELNLSDEQLTAIQAIFDSMNAEARRLGAALVKAENDLEMAFQHNHVSEDRLKALIDTAATLDGQLRYTHLSAHLQTHALLSEDQIFEYDRIRGYASE